MTSKSTHKKDNGITIKVMFVIPFSLVNETLFIVPDTTYINWMHNTNDLSQTQIRIKFLWEHVFRLNRWRKIENISSPWLRLVQLGKPWNFGQNDHRAMTSKLCHLANIDEKSATLGLRAREKVIQESKL